MLGAVQSLGVLRGLPTNEGLPELFDSRLNWFGCGLSVLDQARALCPLVTAKGHTDNCPRLLTPPALTRRASAAAVGRWLQRA